MPPKAGDAVAARARVTEHLAAFGRDQESFGREWLTIFARNRRETANYLRQFQDTGGTRGCVHSMNKGLGNGIDAHIEYVARIKRLVDTG